MTQQQGNLEMKIVQVLKFLNQLAVESQILFQST
jgi:hypothetical protein